MFLPEKPVTFLPFFSPLPLLQPFPVPRMAESLPQSIQSLFGPVVLEIDQAITSVQISQKELSQEMDKLTSGI